MFSIRDFTTLIELLRGLGLNIAIGRGLRKVSPKLMDILLNPTLHRLLLSREHVIDLFVEKSLSVSIIYPKFGIIVEVTEIPQTNVLTVNIEVAPLKDKISPSEEIGTVSKLFTLWTIEKQTKKNIFLPESLPMQCTSESLYNILLLLLSINPQYSKIIDVFREEPILKELETCIMEVLDALTSAELRNFTIRPVVRRLLHIGDFAIFLPRKISRFPTLPVVSFVRNWVMKKLENRYLIFREDYPEESYELELAFPLAEVDSENIVDLVRSIKVRRVNVGLSSSPINENQ